jgi:hypothetical protein
MTSEGSLGDAGQIDSAPVTACLGFALLGANFLSAVGNTTRSLLPFREGLLKSPTSDSSDRKVD